MPIALFSYFYHISSSSSSYTDETESTDSSQNDAKTAASNTNDNEGSGGELASAKNSNLNARVVAAPLGTANHRQHIKSIEEKQPQEPSSIHSIQKTQSASQKVDNSDRDQFGNNAFHKSVISGDLATSRAILDQHPDLLDQPNDALQTPLHLAVIHGRPRLVEFLLAKGANVNAKDNSNRSILKSASWYSEDDDILRMVLREKNLNIEELEQPTASSIFLRLLLVASQAGNLELVEYIVASNRVDLTRPPGTLSIFNATEAGHVDIVRFLKTKVRINTRSDDDTTLLHAAVKSPSQEMVQLILNEYVESDSIAIDFKNKRGETALLFAAKNKNLLAVELLIRAKANISERDKDGNTIWHHAAKSVPMINLLMRFPQLKDAALIQDKNRNSETLLYPMIENGVPAAHANWFFEQGIDLNAQDSRQRTVLHWAIILKRMDWIDALLNQEGVDVNVQDLDGNTYLHFAVQNRLDSLIQSLLAHGADPDIRNKSKKTPGDLNEQYAMLLNRSTGYERLYHSAIWGRLPTIQFLVSHGFDINKVDAVGYTALHYAIDSRREAVVRFLLDQESIDVNVQDKSGNTCLHLAVWGKLDSVIPLLLARGADPNIRNYEGKTPLDIAATTDRRLLSLFPGKEGYTPDSAGAEGAEDLEAPFGSRTFISVSPVSVTISTSSQNEKRNAVTAPEHVANLSMAEREEFQQHPKYSEWWHLRYEVHQMLYTVDFDDVPPAKKSSLLKQVNEKMQIIGDLEAQMLKRQDLDPLDYIWSHIITPSHSSSYMLNSSGEVSAVPAEKWYKDLSREKQEALLNLPEYANFILKAEAAQAALTECHQLRAKYETEDALQDNGAMKQLVDKYWSAVAAKNQARAAIPGFENADRDASPYPVIYMPEP
ncbi:MAG: hypothetical protein C5B47_00055 [Verrucomicrobia bacterium]|nr:MAG: hypothetical protein C5B47_00055 [Verrucomicrobiota bacterium]